MNSRNKVGRTELEDHIQVRFQNKQLLVNALTHSSFLNEQQGPRTDNERLEFLGDSILGFIINEYLFLQYPQMREGEMARIKSDVVSEKSLAEAARKLELGKYLQFSRGEKKTGGARRPSILADAFEALIAAVFLDAGLDSCRNFVLKYLQERITYASNQEKDPKTALQEWLQARSMDMPLYTLLETSGPDHAPEFTVALIVGSGELARCVGSSRKRAEIKAAELALRFLRKDENHSGLARK